MRTDRRRLLVLHNAVDAESPADALDVMTQARTVTDTLAREGFEAQSHAIDLRLELAIEAIRQRAPDVIFNLVEAIEDDGQLVPLATMLLDHLRIPYTGADTAAIVVTSHKILTKRWLRAHDLPTPDWWDPDSAPPDRPAPGPWIVKPLWEDASIGMDDDSVVGDFSHVAGRLSDKQRQRPGRWFAERFVQGREINVAVLDGEDGPQVLPVPEIEFLDYPPGKPHIVSYAAKWHEDSFECRHTVRRFLDAEREPSLYRQLSRMAIACWETFELAGYARIDFRVDEHGLPWILEVNTNPCISPDAGFAAAMAEAGIPYGEGLRRIVMAAR